MFIFGLLPAKMPYQFLIEPLQKMCISAILLYKNFNFFRSRMKIRVMKKTKVLLEKPLPLKVSY